MARSGAWELRGEAPQSGGGSAVCFAKFKVQSSRFKVKNEGGQTLFIIIGWAKGP